MMPMADTVIRLRYGNVQPSIVFYGPGNNAETGPEEHEEVNKRDVHGLIKAATKGSLSELQYFLSLKVSPNSHIGKRTPLREAIVHGHDHCVEALLSAGADPNYTVNGVAPLMLAILTKNSSCLSLLIEYGCLVANHVDKEKTSTVMYAAKAGDFSFTQFLVQLFGQGILKDRNLVHETVITIAAINGQRTYLHQLMPSFCFNGDVLKAVVKNDATAIRRLIGEEGLDPNEVDIGGLSPLILSCMLDHRKCLDALLEFQVLLNHFDDTGRTALHYAAACGNPYCMKRLIYSGAIVSMTTRRRENSLIIAVKNGFKDSTAVAITELLYEQKIFSQSKIVGKMEPSSADRFRASIPRSGESEILASVEAFDFSDKNALMHASKAGFLQIVEMLLETGAWVNRLCSPTQRHALIYASVSGHSQVVEKLLERGANVHAVDIKGFSALFYAASHGHISCIPLLLKAGAKIDVKKHLEFTALSLALDNGHTECAELLINSMSLEQLEKRDIKGRNAIIYAAKNGNVTCLRQLLKIGLSLKSTDRLGNNALIYATAGCYLDCMKFLVEEMGISVHHKTRIGLNALGTAAFFNVPSDILHYLVRMGSNVHSGTILSGILPLFSACQNGSERCFRILVSAGADITRRDNLGNSPLDYASKSGNPKVVRLVLEEEKVKGLMIPDSTHQRCMLGAIDSRRVAIVRLFLKMELFDWSWYSHCMASLRPNHSLRALTQSLVVTGISPGSFICDGRMLSPLMLALESGDIPTAKYLISNLYFTEEDYNSIRKDKHITQTLEEMGEPSASKIAQSLSSSPLPLSTLCFLSVSSAIGRNCGLSSRNEAVETLPIPNLFKRKLTFQEPVAQLCAQEWENIYLCLHVRGYGRKTLSLFQLCTQRPQPFMRALYPCDKNNCGCCEGAVSFLKSQAHPLQFNK